MEDQPAPDRLDDGESAALLALNRVFEVPALASGSPLTVSIVSENADQRIERLELDAVDGSIDAVQPSA